jgi:DNA polymerase-3 subunit epsilon
MSWIHRGAAPEVASVARQVGTQPVDGFMVIDFETAGTSRATACAVGWAVVVGHELVDIGSELIDPLIADDEWAGFNIALHGITPGSVRGASPFSAVWNRLDQRRRDLPLVAHNASFDIGLICDESRRHGLSLPELRFACSAQLSRRAWPDLVSGSLSYVAEWLDIDLSHHAPASDAYAAAMITLKAVNALGCSSLSTALEASGLKWGELGPNRMTPFDFSPAVHARTLDADYEVAGIRHGTDPMHPLFGKVVVFTGALMSMSRGQAQRLVYEAGGTPGAGVNKHTSHLVTGQQDFAKLKPGASQSSKFEKAQALRAHGQDIEVIAESDFVRLLRR